MAIPHRHEPEGNGYFTFRAALGITSFLWFHRSLVLAHALGTFLGQWNFFGPYGSGTSTNSCLFEQHQSVRDHVDQVFKKSLPNFWLTREIFGLALVGFYIVARRWFSQTSTALLRGKWGWRAT
jgi:hypothetical protein